MAGQSPDPAVTADDPAAASLARLRADIDAMVDDLRRGGEVPGIAVGEAAPPFVLRDAHGASVSLAERLRDGPVVLSFYRGAWCPVCNTELRGLQTILDGIRDAGAQLIAVSPEAPDFGEALVDELGLGFDVLSDLDQSVSAAYRLRFRLPPTVEEGYRERGLDLEQRNADGCWYLPVPGTFVIDTAGVVRATHVDPNYRERMDPQAILDALGEINRGP